MPPIYKQLDRDRREIRLLTIVPSLEPIESHPNIECTLQTVSLLDQPNFEALSYCWGSGKEKVYIVLNGEPVLVTVNLELALRHFRTTPDVPSIKLWADAVCINQDDLQERGHQVSMMRDVYSSAANVRIWLGSELPDTVAEFYVLECLIEDWNLLVRHRWTTSQAEPDFTQHWDALVKFFVDSYWHRAWTTQERVLARSVTVHRGTYSQYISNLLSFSKSVVKYLVQCGNDVQTGLTAQPASTWTYSRQFRTETQQILRAIGRQRAFHPSSGESLDEFLQFVRGAEATDPRDCVYGTLGLFPELDIVPDYNKPLEAVFEEFSFEVMKVDKSFDLLYQVVPTELNIPSWTVDLQNSPGIDEYRRPRETCFNRHNLYDAGLSTSFREPQLLEGGILRTPALIIDKITDKQPFQFRPGYSQPILPRDGDDSWVRTLWADAIFGDERDNRRFQEEDLPRCRKVLEELHDGVLTATGTDFVRARLLNLTKVFDFCTSEKGRIGLCPPYVSVGDLVCIFPTAHMPMCIRECSGKTDTYEFVSACYLHGVMDGETVLEAANGDRTLVESVFSDILLQ